MILTCPKGQYAEVMAGVRAKIKLEELGITGGITTRMAATGAIIIEVPGAEHGPKADALTARIREVLRGKEGVRVDRPVRTAEVCIWGLDTSIWPEEAAEALAAKGGCDRQDVRVGDLRVEAGKPLG